MAAGNMLTLSADKGDIYYTTDGSDPRRKGGSIAETASKFVTEIPLVGPSLQVHARVRLGSSGQLSIWLHS